MIFFLCGERPRGPAADGLRLEPLMELSDTALELGFDGERGLGLAGAAASGLSLPFTFPPLPLPLPFVPGAALASAIAPCATDLVRSRRFLA